MEAVGKNPVLFDSLTKAGYADNAISSVGKFSGFILGVDMNEQVQDNLLQFYFNLFSRSILWCNTLTISVTSSSPFR